MIWYVFVKKETLKMKNILYYNNCWMTNIGEAFIDIGACKLLNNLNSFNVIGQSSMSEWYLRDFRKRVYTGSVISKIRGKKAIQRINLTNCFKLQDYYKPDYFVLAGMFASEQMANSETQDILNVLKKRGTEIIFLGLGGEHYNNKERDYFSHFLDSLSPKLVVTRDNATYESYKDVAECYDGIDCALWVSEVYNPQHFLCDEYFCVTFNRREEPSILELGIKNTDKIVRPIHSLYGTSPYSNSLKKEKVFLSDSPIDYLSLYANAKAVYTDMVHATLVSLMYETPVKYFYFDHRSEVIYSLPIYEIDGFLKLEMNKLAIKKREIENIVRKYIT